MKEVAIYTDGGCSGNPGPGGWAFVILSGDSKVMLSGGEAATTNNRMELTAVISALRYISLNMQDSAITLYTDSQYVQQGITQWIGRWLRNGCVFLGRKEEACQECGAVADPVSAGPGTPSYMAVGKGPRRQHL